MRIQKKSGLQLGMIILTVLSSSFDGSQSWTFFAGGLYTDFSTNGAGPNPESTFQTPFTAGSLTKLWCRVKTAASGASTVVLRQNSANASNTFSIGSGLTGAFSDSTPHTDIINSGDLLDVAITPGSTALVITILAVTFTASSNTQTVVNAIAAVNTGSISFNTNYFGSFFGVTSFNASPYNTTEANSKTRQRKSMTASGMMVDYLSLSGGVPTTVTSRKNGANGNMIISINGSTSGIFQDTTAGHSDSLSAGDDFNCTFKFTSSSGGEILIMIGCYMTSTNGDVIFCCSNDELSSFNTSVTTYAGLAGGLETTQSTETNAQVLVNTAYKFSSLTTNVISNGCYIGICPQLI